MKPISPQLGFNNNVRHKGRVFHIQTEDSGVKRPHIITHLFMDGGRILKSHKTSYAEFLDEDELAKKIRSLMQEQHKAMFIALRAGKFDHMFEPAAEATGALASSDANASAAATVPPAPADPGVAPASEVAAAASHPPLAEAPTPLAETPTSRSAEEEARFVRASLPSTTGVSLPPGPPPGDEAALEPSQDLGTAAPAAEAPEAVAAEVALARSKAAEVQPAPPPSAPGASRFPPPAPPAALRPPSRSRLEALGRDASPASPPPRPQAPAPAPARPNARPPLSASLDLDLEALERAAEQSTSPRLQQPRDMPPPPSAVRRPALMNTSYRSVTPQATHVATASKSIPPRAPGGQGVTPPQGSPPATSAPAASKYAPSRPAAIFGQSKPQERSSIFGEDLISEKSLDEVILSYLAEDLDGPGKK
jgi:hypothetical protein